jgi:predicted permease
MYLFFLPLGFIAYPAILALAYKIAWDFFEEESFLNAIIFSIIPVIVFFVGFYVLKKIKSL